MIPMRSVFEEPRPSAPPGRTWRDWALVAVVAGSGLLEGMLRDVLPSPALTIALTLVLAPLLLWRRSHPLAVVTATFGGIATADISLRAMGSPTLDSYTMLYVLLLGYALFRWGSGREAVAGLAVIAVPAALSLLEGSTGTADAIGGVGVLMSSFTLGWAVRTRHEAKDRREQQMRSEERVLLARELHDTVAHHVSAIAVHAQAGLALARTSAQSPLEALEVINLEASRTLAEMRMMVRVLRNEAPAQYTPQPGVADIERLSRDSPGGPRVKVNVSGDAAGLPAAIDAALYRIAQEAVTNALRHARNATVVDVRVAATRTTLTLVVEDDGDPSGLDISATGYGLTGMKERAMLLGGACDAGPRPGRGWSVRATLPRQVST